MNTWRSRNHGRSAYNASGLRWRHVGIRRKGVRYNNDGPIHAVTPENLALVRAQGVDESRLVQIMPLKKQIEERFLQSTSL
jgi:hypothetical protein